MMRSAFLPLALLATGAAVALAAPATVTKTVTITASASACSISTSTTSSAVNTNPTTTLVATATGTKGLNNYAKAIGKKYFGTAADIPGPEQMDQFYMAQLNNTHDFGQLTPANYMKYEFTEPEQGVFNYTGGDVILDTAETNGQVVRCHNLIWYNQLPNWLTSGTWDNATLIAVMENHITNLVSHWGSRCYAWDVINEALNDNGTYRSDIWYNTIGPAYIPLAYRAAQKAAPAGVKLYYNDYNIEYPGPKSTAAQAIVSELKDMGIRIDGVGLQSHFIIGETPSQASQEQNMAAFTALDVEVAITELDIRTNVPASFATEQQQVQDFANTAAACANTAGCVGITLWDFDDTYSWIPSTFAGQGYGDPWFQPNGPGTPLVRKAAYDGIVDGLTNKSVTAPE